MRDSKVIAVGLATCLWTATMSFCTMCAAATEEAVFVDKGKALGVREIGDKWTCKEGSLVCGGPDNVLVAGKAIGAGDFRIRARLSVEQLDGTAASLVIGGNHFGFDGRGKRIFVEGPAFGPTRLLGDAGKFIAPGKPFDVELARKGTMLSFRIDGSEIHGARYKLAPVCAIGLRPSRATMRIYDFSARGKMTPVTERAISRMQGQETAIEVNGIDVELDDLPKGLLIPDGLGIVTTPALSGKLLYKAKYFADCPRATPTPGGDYLLMFPAGTPMGWRKTKCNDMMALRSKDKGKSWTDPKIAFDIDYSQHGFIPFIPKGSKRIYAFGTQPIPGIREITGGVNENCPIGFRYSDDDGHTWSKVTLIKPVNDPSFQGMSCMRMCETDGGTWVVGAHEGDWAMSPLRTYQYMLRSEDQGRTWTVAPGPRHTGWFAEGFNRMDEGRPISLGGENLMMMARTPEGHLWNAYSEDGGKNWSKPAATLLVHPDAPPMLFHLSDGKTLAAFHHNRHHDLKYTTLDGNKVEVMKDRQEIWVAFSKDNGKNWSEPRFVFANAMTKKLDNPWWTYNCSYIDMFVDDGICNVFVSHRWSRILHLRITEKDLFTLPTRGELKDLCQAGVRNRY